MGGRSDMDSAYMCSHFLYLDMVISSLRQRIMNKAAFRNTRTHRDIEHELQVGCVRWFNYQYPMLRGCLVAVPNGGRRDAITGARLKAEGVTAGVADLILFHRRKDSGALLIEMKTLTGRQSPEQKQWQTTMEAQGYKYVVCRSFDEFRRIINGYLTLEHD